MIVLASILSISAVATVQTISSSAALANKEPMGGSSIPIKPVSGAEPIVSTTARAIARVRLIRLFFDIVVFSFEFI